MSSEPLMYEMKILLKSIVSDHEPDLVAISKEWPLLKHPMTREMEVVMEVMEKGTRIILRDCTKN